MRKGPGSSVASLLAATLYQGRHFIELTYLSHLPDQAERIHEKSSRK